MAKINGAGGYLTVFHTADTIVDPAERRFDVARWTLDPRSQAVDVSNASADGTRYAHIQGDVSWTCDLPLDDTTFPAASGLRRGDVVFVWFKYGQADVYDRLQQTTVMSVMRETNSAGEVVRLSVMGAGGTLTEAVPGPIGSPVASVASSLVGNPLAPGGLL